VGIGQGLTGPDDGRQVAFHQLCEWYLLAAGGGWFGGCA
jgi:hypothetical protein